MSTAFASSFHDCGNVSLFCAKLGSSSLWLFRFKNLVCTKKLKLKHSVTFLTINYSHVVIRGIFWFTSCILTENCHEPLRGINIPIVTFQHSSIDPDLGAAGCSFRDASDRSILSWTIVRCIINHIDVMSSDVNIWLAESCRAKLNSLVVRFWIALDARNGNVGNCSLPSLQPKLTKSNQILMGASFNSISVIR